jgi:hypothetical protein
MFSFPAGGVFAAPSGPPDARPDDISKMHRHAHYDGCSSLLTASRHLPKVGSFLMLDARLIPAARKSRPNMELGGMKPSDLGPMRDERTKRLTRERLVGPWPKAVWLAFLAISLRNLVQTNHVSRMRDFSEIMTVRQLCDLVAFLETLR